MSKLFPESPPPSDHEHDWRKNPHVMFTSNPPQFEVRCVICGKSKLVRAKVRTLYTNDPKTWPKYEEK